MNNQPTTQEDAILNLKVKVSDLDLLLTALRELPYKVSANLIHSLITQYQVEKNKQGQTISPEPEHTQG